MFDKCNNGGEIFKEEKMSISQFIKILPQLKLAVSSLVYIYILAFFTRSVFRFQYSKFAASRRKVAEESFSSLNDQMNYPF